MTTHTPLDIRRLTPLQLGLAIASLVMVVAVVALLVWGFASASAARSALSSGHLFTDLGNIQRSVYELHLTTIALLEQDPQQVEKAALQARLITEQISATRDASVGSPSTVLGLDKLCAILADYERLLATVPADPSVLGDATTRDRLFDVLGQLERSAQSLYDREEARFFQRVSDGLNGQRTSNMLLLLMSIVAAAFATLLALSLNQSVRFEFERAYRMLETLYRADEELHRNVSLDQVGAALVAAGSEILAADKAVLFVWDADHENLVPQVWRGLDAISISAQYCAIGDQDLSDVARAGQIVAIEDIARDRDALPPVSTQENVRAVAYVPISIGEQSYGVLALCSARPRAVDNDERRLLAALARRAASAIENARLYDLAQVSATVQERQRLARELHDAVTQTLFAASLIAEVLPRIWARSPEAGMARLEELGQLTRGALAEMRTLLLELRPQALLEADPGELFRQLSEAVAGRSRLPVALDLGEHLELTPEVKVAYYRIAQEALNNVVKHAGATQVHLSLLAKDGQIVLVVADDGKGFDPDSIPPTHLGLGIMQERAQQIGAELDIVSEIGSGTRVVARWRPQQEQAK